MDHPLHLTEASRVHEVMACSPQTLEVFLHHRMACVGCAMARFCTLAEAASAYHLDCRSLVDELELATRQLSRNQGDST